MQFVKIVGLLVLAGVLALSALVLMKITPRIQPTLAPDVATFEACVKAGNVVLESYPRQCRTADDRLFVENIVLGDTDEYISNYCKVAGCSGQLCVPAIEAGNILTRCEYRAEYACYKTAKCEPRSNGGCGWTQTPELTQCLAHPPVKGEDIPIEVR